MWRSNRDGCEDAHRSKIAVVLEVRQEERNGKVCDESDSDTVVVASTVLTKVSEEKEENGRRRRSGRKEEE